MKDTSPSYMKDTTARKAGLAHVKELVQALEEHGYSAKFYCGQPFGKSYFKLSIYSQKVFERTKTYWGRVSYMYSPTSRRISTTSVKGLLDLFDRLRRLAFSQHPLQDSGVTMPQLALLDWVAASPGCGVQEIADGLGLTAPTVSVGVRRLEKAGLLERQPDPQDGRAIQLFLTTQGQALCQRARAFRRDKMQRLLKGLTPEESATLLTLLERAISAAGKEAM